MHFAHHKVADGDRTDLGRVVLEYSATPGHTPESISVVIWQDAEAAGPYGVLTGDTLFIGDVGRPDLGSPGSQSAYDMAHQLYDPLHAKLLTLPDHTWVYPAHGAGSSCGKNLSTETSSTIGEQHCSNKYALRPRTVDELAAR